jgi:hypothetical protein
MDNDCMTDPFPGTVDTNKKGAPFGAPFLRENIAPGSMCNKGVDHKEKQENTR